MDGEKGKPEEEQFLGVRLRCLDIYSRQEVRRRVDPMEESCLFSMGGCVYECVYMYECKHI